MSAFPRSRTRPYRVAPLLGALLLGAACSHDSTAPSSTAPDSKPSLAVSQARRMTCFLTPSGGSTTYGNVQSDFRARWLDTASCAGSPLDGKTVEIRQLARLRPLGNGTVGGPTQIAMCFFSACVQGDHFRGQAYGDFGELPRIRLDFRANSPGGVSLRGTETLTVDRLTGAVTSFVPGPLRIIFDDGTGPF